MRQKTFHIKFMGDDWRLILQSDAAFSRSHPEPESADATALTDFSAKKIWFRASEFTLYHVIHELIHARFGYNCLDEASLSHDQMEEIFAKYMGEHGESHLKTSKGIFRKMASHAEKMVG